MRAALGAALALVLLVPAVTAGCLQHRHSPPIHALVWLVDHGNPDGGYPIEPGGPSDFSTSAWVAVAYGTEKIPEDTHASLRGYLDAETPHVLANASAGPRAADSVCLVALAESALSRQHPRDPTQEFVEARTLLKDWAGNRSLSNEQERLLLGTLGRIGETEAAGPLASRIRSEYDPPPHTEPGSVRLSATTALALLAAGVSASDPLVADLSALVAKAQSPEGGFPEFAGGTPDAPSTAGALALMKRVGTANETAEALASAFLRQLQTEEGNVRFSSTLDRAPFETTALSVLGWQGTGPFAR